MSHDTLAEMKETTFCFRFREDRIDRSDEAILEV